MPQRVPAGVITSFSSLGTSVCNPRFAATWISAVGTERALIMRSLAMRRIVFAPSALSQGSCRMDADVAAVSVRL
jgi:hypothetical protein